MTFGCSLKQAWGTDCLENCAAAESSQRSPPPRVREIVDNARAHEYPSLDLRPPPSAVPPPAPPEPETPAFAPDALMRGLIAGAATLFVLDAAYRMGIKSAAVGRA